MKTVHMVVRFRRLPNNIFFVVLSKTQDGETAHYVVSADPSYKRSSRYDMLVWTVNGRRIHLRPWSGTWVNDEVMQDAEIVSRIGTREKNNLIRRVEKIFEGQIDRKEFVDEDLDFSCNWSIAALNAVYTS